MAGLVQSRDGVLQDRINNINALASRVIQSVNAVHSAGVGIDGTGGLNFFSGTDATNVAVNPNLTAKTVAASRMTGTGPYTHADGDSSNAVALAALQNAVSQRSVGLTNVQIKQILLTTTVDNMAPGVDEDSGYGILMALPAVQAAIALP